VLQLLLGDDDTTVAGVEISAGRGRRVTASGRSVVIAAGCIDSCRLLLASPGRTGGGLGNEHDNVGRWFMDHLSVDSGILVPGRVPLVPEIFRERRRTDGRSQPMLWLGDDILRREGLPNAAFWIDDLDPAYLTSGVGAARKLRMSLRCRPHRGAVTHAVRTVLGAPDLVRYAMSRQRFRRRRPSVLSLRILTEQLPNRESRVRLSNRQDASGLQRVDVDWKISDADVDVIVQHQKVLARLLDDRGAATLVNSFDRESHPSPVMSNFHHLGGTRMHVDPRRGVVDSHCRVHSTNNLYVVGGSVFPAGGYLNPTLTIIALAQRIAETIVRR
jgi:choline dehydrogenase-like flavoprotein